MNAKSAVSENVLAIDIGTQSSRASVVTADGEILGITQIQHETDSPHTGWSQQRPAQWWAETCQAIRSVLAQSGAEPQSIVAVATCGLIGRYWGQILHYGICDALEGYHTEETGRRFTRPGRTDVPLSAGRACCPQSPG